MTLLRQIYSTHIFDSNSSQRESKSLSPEEQLLKTTLSEVLPDHVIPTIVGTALDDGLQSAQRSAAESRAESTRPTFAEETGSRKSSRTGSRISSRKDSISSQDSTASDASTVISVDDGERFILLFLERNF